MVERAAAQVYRRLAAAQSGLARLRDRRNHCAPERTRSCAPPRADAAAQRPRRRAAMSPALPPGPDFSASNAICSRSPARSRRCSVPTASSNRSPHSAANWRKSVTPSPRRCRAGRSNRSKMKSARCPAASTIPARAASTARRWPASSARSSEIREVLRSLTPAEQLAGYDEAIRNLGAKLDLILRANDDPSTVQQLEGAIAALRAIVSNVASNDALARLSDDVHTLSSKVDQLARSEGNSDSFAILEQRIAALTSTLETRERPAPAKTPSISKARCGRCPTASTACRSATTALRPSPISNSACPICWNGSKRRPITAAGNLGRVEDGLQDILRHLETQQATLPRWPRTAAARPNQRRRRPGRHRQARTVRHPLQPGRNRPPHPGFAGSRSQHARPCGRSAGDDRRRSARGSHRRRSRRCRKPPTSAPAACPHRSRRRAAAMPPQAKPELPNPAAAQPHFAAAPREFHAAPPRRQRSGHDRRARDQRNSGAACGRQPRAAIEPELPPDHPLEPGTRPTGRRLRRRSASRRPKARSARFRRRAARKPSTSSFIAAARRAAQAAAAAPAAGQGRARPAQEATPGGQGTASTITSKIRSLLVGASVVVIVLGTFKMAMTLLDGGPAAAAAADGAVQRAAARVATPAEHDAKPAMPAPATPSMTSPTPIGRQSMQRSRAGRARQRRVDADPAGRLRRLAPPPATSPARSRPRRMPQPSGRKLAPGPGAADREIA